MSTRLIDVHTVMPYNKDMDRGLDTEAYNAPSSKRYGSAFSSKHPTNTLDAMLDYYLAFPTSAPVIIKQSAASELDYQPHMFSDHIPEGLNHEAPRGDVGQASHPDTSWAHDRD